jgi:G3E family GTPase
VLCADRLLLSKLDLVDPDQARALHACLDDLNPGAERASFPTEESASHALTNWLLLQKQKQTQEQIQSAGPHKHSHSQGQLTAVSFEESAPLLGDRLLQLVERYRRVLYRVKGNVHIAGELRRGFLELAGDRLSLRFGAPWQEGETPNTELVLIGDELDEAALRRQLWACRAG